MRRSVQVCLVIVMVGWLAGVAGGAEREAADRDPRGFAPGRPFGPLGPVFERVRGAVDETPGAPDIMSKVVGDPATVDGRSITGVQYTYRNQPPEFQVYATASDLDPIVYMSTQYTPRCWTSFVRVDFNAQVSLVPGEGGFAGLGYAVFVKEDGGDGAIEYPGEALCGGDDTCGYLEQTEFGLWLAASTNALQYGTVATSNFFSVRCHRTLEIQAHIYPVHGSEEAPGEVYVNAGFIALTGGR
jgi:hypothetical protein